MPGGPEEGVVTVVVVEFHWTISLPEFWALGINIRRGAAAESNQWLKTSTTRRCISGELLCAQNSQRDCSGETATYFLLWKK